MEREHVKYQRLLDFCRTVPPTTTAVAHPCDESSLKSAVDAAKLGLIAPILVGPRKRIEAVAKEHGIDLTGLPIVDAEHSHDAADKAVALVREGKAEALARVAALLAQRGAALPLERLALRQELIHEYRELLPDLDPHEWRRVRGEQDLIVRYEPERAMTTLPILLRDPADREKLITLARRLLADERLQRAKPSSEQMAMLSNIGETLHVEPLRVEPLRGRRRSTGTRTATKATRKPATKRKRAHA